ncbi:hypothetical protein DB30_04633 [Enhygromyxa salina]|uniref:Uncharacterized protein n=1 Tax=Enhygromyxa salina TaxID=215803 RepID=A0A0C2A6Z6_9BACT|nr:hypothetical protein [Enhygromyxa salina]KIG19168.1 hypothetical protein DB30_04633 [Enhygromyxa salina]
MRGKTEPLADIGHPNLMRLLGLVVFELGPVDFTIALLGGQPFNKAHGWG